jgi:tetratricopeptide (TPR) repeat protein
VYNKPIRSAQRLPGEEPPGVDPIDRVPRTCVPVAHSDRIRRQQIRQIVREAEGYLELITSLEQYTLESDVRDRVAQRALATLSRLPDTITDRAVVLYLRGEAFKVMQRYADAIVPLEESAALDRDNLATHLSLGWCYKRIGRIDLAIEALQVAQSAEPDEAIVYYNLACYWSLANNKNHAIENLSRAIAIDAQYRDLIDREKDFDSLRSDPDFQAITAVIV